MYAKDIRSIANVKDFFNYLIYIEDLNFHPDTVFNDYICILSNKRSFNVQQASHYQKLLQKAFDICKKDEVCIYDICHEIFLNRLAI